MADSLRGKVAKAASHDEVLGTDESLPDFGLDLDMHRRNAEIARRQSDLRNLEEAKGVHSLRVRYCARIYWLVVFWLVGVFYSVIVSGIKAIGFVLSDSVLIAFITSTTVTVVRLFVLVAKWLFPDPMQSGRIANDQPKASVNRSKPKSTPRSD